MTLTRRGASREPAPHPLSARLGFLGFIDFFPALISRDSVDKIVKTNGLLQHRNINAAQGKYLFVFSTTLALFKTEATVLNRHQE